MGDLGISVAEAYLDPQSMAVDHAGVPVREDLAVGHCRNAGRQTEVVRGALPRNAETSLVVFHDAAEDLVCTDLEVLGEADTYEEGHRGGGLENRLDVLRMRS